MKHLESEHQQALFKWAKLSEKKCPELKLLHAIPNGGKRDIRTATRLKAEGVKAGVPDICLPIARKGYHGLYIELKIGKGKPTEKQVEWQKDLEEQGYQVLVCRGWVCAREEIERYLGI